MKYLGTLPVNKVLYKKKLPRDPFVREFLIKRNLQLDKNQYDVMTSTSKRFVNAALKYDRAYDPLPLNQNSKEWADKMFKKILDPHLMNSQVLAFDDIDAVPYSDPSYPYNMQFSERKMFTAKHPKIIEEFWVRSANEYLPSYWSVFLKTEMLRMVKLETNDARSIINCPVDLAYSAGRLCRDVNRRLGKLHFRTPIGVGFSKFLRGTDNLAKLLNRFKWKEESDVSKWDTGFHPFLHYTIMEMRWHWMDPKFKTAENRKRLENFYRDAVHTRMVLPNGEVYMKSGGMPSGWINTTYDNTMGHLWFLLYCWAELVGTDSEAERMWFEEYFVQLYGDDNISAYTDRVKQLFNPDKRRPFYEMFGFKLPQEKIKMQEELEGLQFLGFNFIRRHNTYVPLYNVQKALESWMKPDQNITTKGKSLARAIGLLIEVYFDPSTRKIFRDYITELQQQGVTPDVNELHYRRNSDYLELIKSVPSNRKIKALYLAI